MYEKCNEGYEEYEIPTYFVPYKFDNFSYFLTHGNIIILFININ